MFEQHTDLTEIPELRLPQFKMFKNNVTVQNVALVHSEPAGVPKLIIAQAFSLSCSDITSFCR
jgi:hypothetical protein